MDNPYAFSPATLPARSPRRAPFSATVATLSCLFIGFRLVAFAGANSSTMSSIGMFASSTSSPQIERLRLLWKVAEYSTLVCAVACILLGALRLSANKIQWFRRVAIWTIVVAIWRLAEFTLDLTRPLLTAAG